MSSQNNEAPHAGAKGLHFTWQIVRTRLMVLII